MRVLSLLLLSLALVHPAWTQLPEQVIQAEREKLLAGVKSIPKAGAPGPVAIWGTLAFPMLASPGGRDGTELAVAAVAGHGKGRIVLFGHNSYLNGQAGGDHARLLSNCIQWSGKKQKPRIGLKNVNAISELDKLGFKAEAVADLSENALARYDVLILNAQSINDPAEGEQIVQWVARGGGLIAGMTGWAFGQTSGGKNLASSHGLNQALMPAGIAFTDLSGFDQTQAFQARTELPLLLNASEAINALKQQKTGGRALNPEEMKQATSAIQIAMAAQPPDRNSLQEAVTAAIANPSARQPIPTKEEPLTQARDAEARVQLGMETRMLKLAPGAVNAHPAHEVFPGKAPTNAPRVSAEVSVQPTVPGWTSTGLYAAAGETIQVTVPATMADQGYAVRIGSHSDLLYNLDRWSRAPDITKSLPLTSPITSITSAFGGLIYIEVPARAKTNSPFNAQIKGGLQAPYFVLGRDTDEQWNTDLKKRPAPWAELACDQMILTVPSEVARTVTTPTLLMEFWKRVVEAQDDISNQSAERKRPERMVADVQISAGFMHSGYPIMLHLPEALEMVTFNRIKFPGWGFHHEIGHNHQRGDFTFDGTGEVTNNVMGMYIYEAVLKKDWLIGHTAISPERRRANLEKLKQVSDKWAQWKSDPFYALHSYIQLVQAFGWESWRAYLHSFADPQFGPAPKSDDEKRDQFLVRYSKITKRDLGPFFDAWGIPVSTQAKAEVSSLETWMPAEM